MHGKKTDKKGISIFISHVIAIAILFVIMILVSVQFYNYYYSVKNEVQESQAKVLSQRVANDVLNLYTNYKYSNYELKEGENKTLSEVYINIPEKISGNNYIISLEQHGEFWIEGGIEGESSSEEERPYMSVRVKIESKPLVTYDYPIYNLISANVSGSVRMATKIKLSYVRENENGVLKDYIIMERVQ